MERIKIAALFADSPQLDGQTVTVCGWARTIRDMKTFGFIELNDGSCFRNLQIVMDASAKTLARPSSFPEPWSSPRKPNNPWR